MCTVITHPSTSSEVLSRLRVQADVVVAGRGVAVALAWAAVVRLYLISSSEGLVIEERRAAIALLERVRDQSAHLHTSSTYTFISNIQMRPQGLIVKSPQSKITVFPYVQDRVKSAHLL